MKGDSKYKCRLAGYGWQLAKYKCRLAGYGYRLAYC
jgi:hypothetical protein